MRYIVFSLLLFGLTGCVPARTPVPTGALVVINGTVIDSTGLAPIPDGIVIIENKRIKAVGQAADFAIPSFETTVIDAHGGTILPGFINAHVHQTASPRTRRLYLVEGVTAVCDLGTPLNRMSQFEQEQTRQTFAARGFRAGPMITAPGGYPAVVHFQALNYDVTTPEEARAAVVDLVSRGAEVIKIALEPGDVQDPWPMLDLAQVQAIVTEAHARRKLVVAHLSQAAVLDLILEAGVDVLAHAPTAPQVFAGEIESLQDENGRISFTPDYEAQLSRLVKQGVIMVPTINAIDEVVCPALYQTSAQRQLCFDSILETVHRFHALGGVVALGNDAPVHGERGMPLHEMRLLLRAGLTPLEIIEAGTRHAAQACGHGDELGTLEPGKLADVIVVKGDPLLDIEAMSQIAVVIRAGEIAYIPE